MGDKGTHLRVSHDKVKDILTAQLNKLNEPLANFDSDDDESDIDE